MGSTVQFLHDLFSLKSNLGLISLCCTVQFRWYLMLLDCKIPVKHKTNWSWFCGCLHLKASEVESCGSSHTGETPRSISHTVTAAVANHSLSVCRSYMAAGDICINKPKQEIYSSALTVNTAHRPKSTITLLHAHLNKTIMLTAMNSTAPAQHGVSEETYESHCNTEEHECIIVTVRAQDACLYVMHLIFKVAAGEVDFVGLRRSWWNVGDWRSCPLTLMQ